MAGCTSRVASMFVLLAKKYKWYEATVERTPAQIHDGTGDFSRPGRRDEKSGDEIARGMDKPQRRGPKAVVSEWLATAYTAHMSGLRNKVLRTLASHVHALEQDRP